MSFERDQQAKLNELRTMSVQAGATTARWTLATLALMNAGALATLVKAQISRSLAYAGAFFVWGLVAAVLCGFALTAVQWCLTYMAIQTEAGEDAGKPAVVIVIGGGVGVVLLAAASLVMFTVGCVHASDAISTPAAVVGTKT